MHKPTPAAESRYWNGLLAAYAQPSRRKAWFQLLTTGALFALTWFLMYFSLRGPYWLTLMAALPAAGLLTRLFIFQHDCGHGAFFRSRAGNNLVSAVLHWFTGNIGFHQMHHLASRIPNYRLKECFQRVPELQQVTRLTIRSSLRSARLHLEDEDRGRMVGFRQLGSTATGS